MGLKSHTWAPLKEDGNHANNRRGHKDLVKENLLEVREKKVFPPSLTKYNFLDYFVWVVSEL
jgi:hypothetical protein